MRILRFVVGARREARATRWASTLLLLMCLAWAAPTWASCGDTFTDDPLMPGQTVVKAVHVTELRTAINCLRTAFSLSTVTWTQTLTAGTTVVYDVDVEELRTALNAVYSAASLSAPAYTDTSLSGVAIKAIHLQELRTAVRIVEPADVSEATWVLQYYHTDVIGSVRAITDASGDTVIRHDYAPFGEDTQPLTGNPMRFAGKELDPESAWNYFDARYFRNIYGRFGTVDPVDGTQTDTQSWNKYAYARNNPFVYTDPTGLAYYADYKNGEWGYWKDEDQFWEDVAASYLKHTGSDDRGELFFNPSSPNWQSGMKIGDYYRVRDPEQSSLGLGLSVDIGSGASQVDISVMFDLPSESCDAFCRIGVVIGQPGGAEVMAQPDTYLQLVGGSALGGVAAVFGPTAFAASLAKVTETSIMLEIAVPGIHRDALTMATLLSSGLPPNAPTRGDPLSVYGKFMKLLWNLDSSGWYP